MAVKLADLKPMWIPKVEDGAQACGIAFECPVCPRNDAGGVHYIRVQWANMEGRPPQEVLWERAGGNTFDTLTLNPSILADVTGTCKFHGWIQNGMVTW